MSASIGRGADYGMDADGGGDGDAEAAVDVDLAAASVGRGGQAYRGGGYENSGGRRNNAESTDDVEEAEVSVTPRSSSRALRTPHTGLSRTSHQSPQLPHQHSYQSNSSNNSANSLQDALTKERAKCTLAMQEKARLSVEVTSLKRRLEQEAHETTKLQQSLDELKADKLQQVSAVRKAQRQLDAMEVRAETAERRCKTLEQERDNVESVKDRNDMRLAAARGDVTEMRREKERAGQLIHRLREEVSVKEAELASVREQCAELERAEGEHRELAEAAQRKLDQCKAQLQDSDEAIRDAVRLREQNRDLRNEANESVRKCSDMEKERNRFAGLCEDQSRTIQDLQQELTKCREGLADRNRQLDELEKQLHQEKSVSVARQRAADAAAQKADVALEGRGHIEDQLKQLHETLIRTRSEKHQAVDECARLRGKCEQLEKEAEEWQEQLQEHEAALVEAERAEALAGEVDALRHEMGSLRKQMLETDLEAATSGSGASGFVLEEQRTKQMYDNMLASLREELSASEERCAEWQARAQELRDEGARSAELEEEIEVLHAAVRKSNAELLDKSSALKNAEKQLVQLREEKDAALRDRDRAIADVEAAVGELNVCKDSLDREKRKVSRLNEDLATSERKLADLQAKCAQTEASLDTLRQHHQANEFALSSTRSAVTEHSSKLKVAEDTTSSLTEENNRLSAELEQTTRALAEATTAAEAASHEVDSVKTANGLLTTQCEDLQRDLEQARKHAFERERDIAELQARLVEARSALENNQAEINATERTRAEAQLQELRNDFTQAAADWKKVDSERRKQEEGIQNLRGQLRKEKERCLLLETEVGLMEDQLKAAQKELDVYRKIDVYVTSAGAAQRDAQALRPQATAGKQSSTRPTPRPGTTLGGHRTRQLRATPRSATTTLAGGLPTTERGDSEADRSQRQVDTGDDRSALLTLAQRQTRAAPSPHRTQGSKPAATATAPATASRTAPTTATSAARSRLARSRTLPFPTPSSRASIRSSRRKRQQEQQRQWRAQSRGVDAEALADDADEDEDEDGRNMDEEAGGRDSRALLRSRSSDALARQRRRRLLEASSRSGAVNNSNYTPHWRSHTTPSGSPTADRTRALEDRLLTTSGSTRAPTSPRVLSPTPSSTRNSPSRSALLQRASSSPTALPNALPLEDSDNDDQFTGGHGMTERKSDGEESTEPLHHLGQAAQPVTQQEHDPDAGRTTDDDDDDGAAYMRLGNRFQAPRSRTHTPLAAGDLDPTKEDLEFARRLLAKQFH